MSHRAAARLHPQLDEAREILVVDDDEVMRRRLRSQLHELGYVVREAQNGQQAMLEVQRHRPDLILLDITMPEKDGTAVCRELKHDPRTSTIPVIMLTAHDRLEEKVQALQCGANDYLTKPYNQAELAARIKNTVELRAQLYDANPLTRLAGNTLIERELRQRVATGTPFAYLYVDIDDFKPFNDAYGHQRGDELILATAELLERCVAEHGSEEDFLGHVGGDDFVVLCGPARASTLAEAIVNGFDAQVHHYLNPRERERQCIEVPGRTGQVERHRLPSLTVAVVVAAEGHGFEHAAEVNERAAAVKRNAKAQARRGERGPGSLAVWERRTVA
jgi:diguanylate cyclase (GGDEF)-like protein